MAYTISFFDFSNYTTDFPPQDAQGTTGNALIGGTLVFNGGSPVQIEIDDDDPDFEDGYVETGGAQTLAAPLTIGPTTYPVGSVVQNEYGLVDGAGNAIIVVRINGDNVGITYPSGDEPSPGESFEVVEARDGDPADSTDGVGTSDPYSTFICFVRGTMITTALGDMPVESLRVGHEVLTIDHGLQPIRWIGSRQVLAVGDAAPIEFAPGALGNSRKLRVSRNHCVLISGWQTELLFGEQAVLVAAGHLLGADGVSISKMREVEYFHILFDRHEIIFSESAMTESLYPGPIALNSLTQDQVREIQALRSCIWNGACFATPTARRILRKYEAEVLVAHKNRKASTVCFPDQTPSAKRA